ncbi:MAG TPA: acetyl-CoA C-acyltransferase FadI, partial [Polyangiaceae bacterium]|nr:acetyl-CoA C-acyltransferase FadI [Polyangiaceae bacterium]
FQKQATGYAQTSALNLASCVVAELLGRCRVRASEVGLVVYGQVLPSIEAPNIAREIVLATGMPASVDAFSVSRACATGYQATVSAAQAIMDGSVDCAIAGGADSASDVPITVSKKLARVLLAASKARTVMERVAVFAKLRPLDLLPVAPTVTEFSTGLSMGQSAEKMARENSIGRAEQDAFAHSSHTRAAAAWAGGEFAELVMTVQSPPAFQAISTDNVVRQDSSLESYERLRPAFDRKYGTVTAGNSSALTDGASALLLMSEEKAKAHGLTPLGYLRSYAFAAIDPTDQLLLGPAYATPLALRRAGLALSDMDIIDMHEAFAAQVLCNIKAFESKRFAVEKLGRDAALGTVDMTKFNIWGGSLALGHPFAATGARQVHQALAALRKTGGQ